jgi:hypothetical protein
LGSRVGRTAQRPARCARPLRRTRQCVSQRLPYSELQPPLAPATGVARRRDDYRWNRTSRFHLYANFEKNECEMVLWFGGRESIFLFPHTNEFCGNQKVALEPGLACAPPKVRRWVYEKGRKFPSWQQLGSGLPQLLSGPERRRETLYLILMIPTAWPL